jgi:hypothetical protein
MCNKCERLETLHQVGANPPLLLFLEYLLANPGSLLIPNQPRGAGLSLYSIFGLRNFRLPTC